MKTSQSVRTRLLQAADELFYSEGVHTVGIDRILERAGVAKASLYTTFGSKEELIRAYLERKSAWLQARIESRVATESDPQARIVAVFAEFAERVLQKPFRGCAFVRASSDGSPARPAVSVQRKWLREIFARLATEAGLSDAENLSHQLTMIYDGAMVAVWMDEDPGAAAAAQSFVERLLKGYFL